MAFPPALLEGGREPLAATLSGNRESFRLGTTQLAASMLGVGLDQLIQRDAQRRRTRMRLISAASIGFSAVMGGMSWTAIDARNAAELSRSEAESMVEFMITDLKQDLEPVGKLDILDSVGDRVTDYYDAIPLPKMDDDRLARQARARHLLGQIALDQGKSDKAKADIDLAFAATREVLTRNPEDTDAIFAHAQSAYWVGELFVRAKKYKQAQPYWQEYNNLSAHLYQINPENVDWIMEAAWGQNNLASLDSELQKYKKSQIHYGSAIKLFQDALSHSPTSANITFELANAYAGASRAAMKQGNLVIAKQNRQAQISIYDGMLRQTPNNYDLHYRRAQALTYYTVSFESDPKAQLKNLMDIKSRFESLVAYDPSNTRWGNALKEIKEDINRIKSL